MGKSAIPRFRSNNRKPEKPFVQQTSQSARLELEIRPDASYLVIRLDGKTRHVPLDSLYLGENRIMIPTYTTVKTVRIRCGYRLENNTGKPCYYFTLTGTMGHIGFDGKTQWFGAYSCPGVPNTNDRVVLSASGPPPEREAPEPVVQPNDPLSSFSRSRQRKLRAAASERAAKDPSLSNEQALLLAINEYLKRKKLALA